MVIGTDAKYAVEPVSVGDGGFGDAYKVQRVSDGEWFIAKVNRDPRKYLEAVEEGKRLQSYKHRNIVGFIDSFPVAQGLGSTQAIVMEYCDGNAYPLSSVH